MSEKKKSRRLLQIAVAVLLVFAVAIHLWVSAQFGMWLVIIVVGLLILHIPAAMLIRRSIRRRRSAATARSGS
jgi:F0F1-type ATP synthase assembly protein I